MRIKVVLILLLLHQFLNAQIILHGKIIDSRKEPLNRANIQLTKANDQNIISFSFSDKSGVFEITTTCVENTLLKISAYGFGERIIDLQNYKGNQINIGTIELEKVHQIEEVVLINEKEYKVNKDSIDYNILKIKSNNDKNLGDLINKLSGLELSDEGKVKFQGNDIDKILIDGNEFFGKKHQIATENISVDMIEGISLLFNNNDNKIEKEFEENSKVALNVRLNKESRNKIIGNIAINGSYDYSYHNKVNLFHFKKTGNITLMLDQNNIGESPLSVPDYIEMIGGVNTKSTKNIVNVDSYIPRFIYDRDNFLYKKNTFSALNVSHKTKKIKINANIFFNKSNQGKSEINERYFIDNTQNTLPIFENYIDNDKNQIINSIVKADFTLTDKSYLKSITNININENRFSNNINNNLYNTNKKSTSTLLSQEINYNLKFKENFLFTSNFSFESNLYKNNLNLENSNNNILIFPFNRITQYNNYNFNAIKLNNSMLYKYKKNKYKLFTSLINNNEEYLVHIETNNKLSREILSKKIGIDITQYFNERTSANIATTIVSNTINKTDIPLQLEYNFGINYKINEANNISFIHYNQFETPKVSELFNFPYIEDYLRFHSYSFIPFDKLINVKTLEFSYNNFLVKSNLFFTLNSSYSFSNDNFTTNSNFSNGFNTSEYVLGKKYRYFLTNLYIDKKLKIIPINFRTVVSYKNITTENFYNNIPNTILNNTLAINTKLLTTLKNSKYQFELSQISNFNNTKQNINNTNFNYSSHSINLITKYTNNEIHIEVGLGKLFQKNNGYDINQTLINSNFDYTLNKHFIFSLTLQNILNINDYSFLNQSLSNNMVTNNIQYRLPGYILFGLKYTL